MKYKFWCLLFLSIFFLGEAASRRVRRTAVSSTTPTPDDEDEDLDEEDSSEIDDDSKRYKNPRNSPSTLCPRDEEQATLLGQQCLRKCSSDEDCKSKKKKCLCDGACGLSCIKPDRECPEPEQIAFGSVTASGRLFGARATYSCQHGYHVVGLQSRSCQADGKWAGSPPACKQNIYCLSPPTIDHARHNALAEQTTFDLDSTLQYYCHTGYVTNGFPRAKCLAIDGQASWYGPDISCEPRSCGAPTDISHGWHAGECYTYGCRITYHCAEGYELVGKNERHCQADGTWTPKELPTCVLVTAVQCPPPENPRHGKAIYTSCNYNSVVSYECKYGYTLVGESTRRCGADKKWSASQPVCKEINCGHPGRLWNGWLENIEAGTGLGASIIFRCHEGMMLEGNTSTVCQIDGKWRYPLPKCLAPCVVPHVSQGKVILVSRNDTAATSTVVQHGEALAVNCDSQYEFLASLSPVTCINGTWSFIPKCEPARCKRLPKSPKNGMVLAPKMEHGMKARFRCRDGYKLKGPHLMECSFGNWTGEPPKCEDVFCSFPGLLPNGKILLVGNMGLYDYRNYVRRVNNSKQIMYDCNKGYILGEGPPGATCIGGQWSPKELPICLRGQHPRLRWNRRKRDAIVELYKRAFIRHHKLIYENREKRYIHNYLHYAKDNFIINNKNYFTPRESVSSKTALRKDTKKRPKRGLKGGSIGRGFSKSRKSAKYQLSRRWTNKKVKRNIHDDCGPCEPLPTEPFVNVEVLKYGTDPNVTFSPWTVIKMACGIEYGMNIPENKIATCVCGQWIPTKPMCIKLSCTSPGKLANGKILRVGFVGLSTYRDYEGRIDNGRQIMYECNKGYILGEGPQGATCIEGQWSPKELPICVPEQDMNENREKRYIQNYLHYAKDNFLMNNNNYYIPRESVSSKIATALRKYTNKRRKRALKGGSGSRAFGTSHKSSNSQLNLRRTSKKIKNNIDDDKPDNELGESKRPKHKNRGPCEPLSSEPFVNVEVVKYGRDPNVTFSPGTVVKMACGKGYGLNIPENKTTKCVRGRWRPTKPMCLILPCFVPVTPSGIYKLSRAETPLDPTIDPDQPLNETIDVANGQVVEFSCEEGYNVQGPSNLRCWHGDWAVTSFPECTPAPCQLPKISHGQYTSGYRAGLTIANGSSVTFHCDNDYSQSTTQPIQCILGELNPRNPSCKPNFDVEMLTHETHYLGGSDIVKGGDITVIQYGSPSGKYCGPPAKVRGSLIYKNGEAVVDDENNFPEGTEVTFNCIESIMGEKTTWKIVCEDGSWIGRSHNCDIEELMASQVLINNNTCIFRNQEPNVISFYNDQQIREDVVEFPAGAVLVSRCIDIGKYSMTGPNKRRCMGGDWDGSKPACFGLNQANDYSMEKPPTILFRHQLGPIAQSNDGKLIVYPGTILHMECLWMRRFGNPKWTVSHDYRKYPQGWTTDPGRDSQLEYRLSIFHASKDDSGLFTCFTPARHTHSVEIDVKAIHCPVVPQRRGLTVNTQSTKMNTKLKFTCINGNSLIGAADIMCLPSGNWSAPFPVCESIECGEVGPLGEHLKALIVSREVGGRVVFTCEAGYGLRGPPETVCQASGDWATPYPTCEEVYCDNPTPPENGYIQGIGPYKAGDVVQFNCNPDYMMEGQPIIACQENSRWSGKLTKCVQACSYPGTTISGRMSSVKFYYKIGENITFTCEEGLYLRGAAMLKCLKNGKWSNAIPTCVTENSEKKREISVY